MTNNSDQYTIRISKKVVKKVLITLIVIASIFVAYCSFLVVWHFTSYVPYVSLIDYTITDGQEDVDEILLMLSQNDIKGKRARKGQLTVNGNEVVAVFVKKYQVNKLKKMNLPIDENKWLNDLR